MEPQSILIVNVKITAAFFSFCLFKLLSKFEVMLQAFEKFYSTGKNIGTPVIYYDLWHERFD